LLKLKDLKTSLTTSSLDVSTVCLFRACVPAH